MNRSSNLISLNLISLIQLIFVYIFRCPLSKCAAEKSRNNLAKGLYDKLFGEIMQHVNHHLSCSSSNNTIGILDIAGFGRFEKIVIVYLLLQLFLISQISN